MKPAHVYAVYLGVKQLAVAVVLLVLAFSLSKQINGYYSRSSCAACNDLATQYPKIGFEFSICSAQFTPGISKPNLMTSNMLTPTGSPVVTMVPLGFTLLVIALGYGMWAWWRWDGEFSTGDQLLYNTAVTTFWFMVGNGFFQLFMRSGCYLSAWNMDYMRLQWWLDVFTLLPLLCYALTLTFCYTEDRSQMLKWVAQYVFLGLSVLSVVTMAVFSFYLAQTNLKHTRTVAHWIFSAVMAWSLLDGLLYWYFYRTPAGYAPVKAVESKEASAAGAKPVKA